MKSKKTKSFPPLAICYLLYYVKRERKNIYKIT